LAEIDGCSCKSFAATGSSVHYAEAENLEKSAAAISGCSAADFVVDSADELSENSAADSPVH